MMVMMVVGDGGAIVTGARADFVIIDNLNDFNILKTYVAGECVFDGENVLFESTINSDDNLKYYSTNDNRLKLEGNKIVIENLPEGSYDFTLTRNDNTFNHPIVFYQSNDSQNLVQTGDLETKQVTFHVNSYKTSVTINKIDKDTQEIKSQGEADLNGSIFKIYDEQNNEIKEITIKNNKGIVENLNFGRYYIKEISSGIGYLLNNNIYEFEISPDNPNPEITVENQVINKNIKIIKKYGDTIMACR